MEQSCLIPQHRNLKNSGDYFYFYPKSSTVLQLPTEICVSVTLQLNVVVKCSIGCTLPKKFNMAFN